MTAKELETLQAANLRVQTEKSELERRCDKYTRDISDAETKNARTVDELNGKLNTAKEVHG